MADKFKAKGIHTVAEAVAAKDSVLAEIFADGGRRYGSWTAASFRALAAGEPAPAAAPKAPKAAAATPAKKAGRPKKEVVVSVETAAPAKKTGRPKKVVAPSAEAATPLATKRSGRPKKETTAAPAKKVGRSQTASVKASILPTVDTTSVPKIKLASSTPLRHIKAMGPAITKNLIAEGINSAEGVIAASDETLTAILQNSGAVYRAMTPKALRKRAQEAMD